MVQIIDSSAQQRQQEQKKEIVKYLNDQDNPEMISIIIPEENDLLSLMQTFGELIGDYRVKNGLPYNNITLNFVNRNLALRRSIKGVGSFQLVETTKNVMEQNNKDEDVYNVLKKKLMG